MMKKMASLFMVSSILSSCAAATILDRPQRKNLEAINVGVPRGLVLAEVGAPMSTREKDGEKEDVFAFDKGVGGGEKFLRAFFHVGADIVTIFIWEIIGWPAEKVAGGTNTKMQINYDKDDKVKTVAYMGK
jgi:hypothetical protein